ncbi:MAG TPA: hypothetical protein VNJ01_16460 [Bacteriovoracaceae bacterium]|nr:hypothetical protein [Bacteriovoracaceae bacterium]
MKFLFLAMVVTACSSKPAKLHQASRNIEVFENVPTDCRVLGKFVGLDKTGSKDMALNHALNQAADMGATGVVINQEVPNGKIMNVHTTAYQCN